MTMPEAARALGSLRADRRADVGLRPLVPPDRDGPGAREPRLSRLREFLAEIRRRNDALASGDDPTPADLWVAAMKERDIFVAALEIADPDERDAFLVAACADAASRSTSGPSLQAEAKLGTFLESPAPRVRRSAERRRGPRARSSAPYKLLEEIGEGGMGVVFMAEQTRPVRRRVALKVIKPGMDSRQVIARFEAERQALALMDHPNIARVLDAGATDSGRPYFVMELVAGRADHRVLRQEPPRRRARG